MKQADQLFWGWWQWGMCNFGWGMFESHFGTQLDDRSMGMLVRKRTDFSLYQGEALVRVQPPCVFGVDPIWKR